MTERFVKAGSLEDVERAGCTVVTLEGHTIALFSDRGKIYAVDNRCPHMGFPLHRGTLKSGILTCHWHHARFDLASGGTFDLFADDVRAFPTVVRDGEVWVDLAPRGDPVLHQKARLREGLENDIPLVVAKAAITLLEGGVDPAEPFRVALNFGTRYRCDGWGRGLTILTCLMNLLPKLAPEDRPRAVYHGIAAVAADTAGQPARFVVRPLPTTTTDVGTLKRWFREFVEVRDSEGAERCISSAIRAGADGAAMADMLFAAATDHRYIATGHVADFVNKALEALDVAGWEYAEQTLTSLAYQMARAGRMEEANSWRHPIDLVTILEHAFDALPGAVEKGSDRRGGWDGFGPLVPVLLGDEPQAIADSLLDAVTDGCSEVELAAAVRYAAALRIARFHTSNEFTDWDTALHTFTFANAVHQGLRRSPSVELLRGVFDAAMSVYLDRFLNIPATRLPEPGKGESDPEGALAQLPAVLDKHQQVNQAGDLTARYLFGSGDAGRLVAMLGKLLLREDRDFHTIQAVEACVRSFEDMDGAREATNVLVASARYLAAHAPTDRAQGQSYLIALRLARGERLYEG